ncbi:Anaphase-promoting complex subunit 1 [Taxawa tesnikishii (nom. ined.)]|nr:Anaphase-promoting complex subunit 1 [Dothideales sp. JES 119]
MAGVISLGVHTPSALPYLIQENLLPQDPSPDSYQWTTYDGHGTTEEEELLTTPDCVAWSQDGFVRRLLRFGAKDEKVTHALLTTFTSSNSDRKGRKESIAHGNTSRTSDHASPARALVVFLRSEAQVHFLSGSSHVVSLPFEIDKAFATPAGVLVQRGRAANDRLPESPQLPAAPPNSFFSSQPLLSSQLQSPAHHLRVPNVAPVRPSPLGPSRLDRLFDDLLKGTECSPDDEAPRLYTLTTPIAGFCAVSYAAYCHQPRIPRSTSNAPVVEYDVLDQGEELLYFSHKSELHDNTIPQQEPLMLVVTANKNLRSVTLWQAWYLKPRPLSLLMKQRAEAKELRAKRRASVPTHGTGAVTPATRARDRTRESFAASARLPGRHLSYKQARLVWVANHHEMKRKQQWLRRWIPSFNYPSNNREGRSVRQLWAGGRRGPSLGSVQDRRSFGAHLYRRSRGSTPGSLFNKSLGPDEDPMDVENDLDGDAVHDEVQYVERLMDATHRSAGAESAVGGGGDNKKELVIRKLHTLPIGAQSFPSYRQMSVHLDFEVLALTAEDETAEEKTVSLYVLNRQSQDLDVVKFVARKPNLVDKGMAEWDALIVTLFLFAIGSIEKRELGLARASGYSDADRRSTLAKTKPAPWAWMATANRSSKHASPQTSPRQRRSTGATRLRTSLLGMLEYAAIAHDSLAEIAKQGLEWMKDPESIDLRYSSTLKILFTLHLYSEEQKLDELRDSDATKILPAVIAQLGHWLGLRSWDWRYGNYYELEGASFDWGFSDGAMSGSDAFEQAKQFNPPVLFEWLENAWQSKPASPYLTLDDVANIGAGTTENLRRSRASARLLPRISALQQFISRFHASNTSSDVVECIVQCGLKDKMMETFPEAVMAPMREAISRCQGNPPTKWEPDLLQLIGREDLKGVTTLQLQSASQSTGVIHSIATVPRGVQEIYQVADNHVVPAGTHESSRNAVVSLIFAEDRRYTSGGMPPQPEWSEVEHLEQQKRLMQFVMVRTVALSPGDAMIHFDSQRPMIPEKIKTHGFSTSCLMKPMDNIMTADRSSFTEEKLHWAFFHAGVSAGLAISRHAKGIDTSWVVFNKPAELNNRHAGFLFALGINGHLRSLAKWLAFKYLTPKHNMTSVGLLLGLSASYMGTMDTLITRMLSVHITRMLPPGAAELNVSPLTQTAGMMGIGLLYYNTQHRRMSEVMLSEIENRELEDPLSTTDVLRDESYRLAAGFALGFINLGKGRDLQGLHGMDLLERLLSVAIGPKPVEVVHVIDRAIAGAVMAIALIYMKSEDKAVARKIDIPDTLTQLDHIRPDVLLLRTVAKHLIMWKEISDEPGWIRKNLPKEFAARYLDNQSTKLRTTRLTSQDIPFYNIVTGLAWALSLKYAGSGNEKARDEVLQLLKMLTVTSKLEAYYYDAKLARNTVRRCIDVLALAAATVMAGTGDIETFRHLRRLHGRVDPETTYGSHLAAHTAIGVLFVGGGTYTFGTTDLAIASLLCAFYPLWPTDALDNRVHLQALRHFWVFAAESRCVVAQDTDTQRPIPLNLKVTTLKGAKLSLKAPCLLPELDKIATIETDDPVYWQVVLNFVENPNHLAAFRRQQIIHVRRSPIHGISSIFSSSPQHGLNDMQAAQGAARMWEWILNLPVLKMFTSADLSLVLPLDAHSAVHLDEKGTVADSRLILTKSVQGNGRDELWNLRLLFAWADEAMRKGDGRLRWIGKEVVDLLRTRIEERARRIDGVS